MEKFKLTEYLELCLNFEADHSQDNFVAIQQFLGKMQIIDYLPLKQKILILGAVLKQISEDFDAPGVAAYLEMAILKEGLLHYCVNLEEDGNILTQTYIVYDLVYKYGLADSILAVCEKDYKRLVDMIYNTINVDNIKSLMQTAMMFDPAQYEIWKNTIKDLKEQLTPDLLQGVLALNAMQDENLQKIGSAVAKKQLDQINEELK